MITSGPIIAEVVRTLASPRILGRGLVTVTEIERATTYLFRHSRFTAITRVVKGVATHPEDDLILATAVSGSADHLVTGDRQLLRLRAYESVDIVSPREFLEMLGSSPE